MNRPCLLLGACTLAAGALLGSSTLQAAVLFADTFNRSPAGSRLTHIDSNTTGITSAFALPSVVYVERDEFLAGPANSGPITQPEADLLTHVENDRLQLAYGPNASVVHINHNFVGPGVTNLKASFDVVSNNGAADAVDRWVGMGFGGAQAEANAAVYDATSTNANKSWKGAANGSTTGSGFADFFVAWERKANSADTVGRVALYKNGIRQAFFENGGAFYPQGGKLEVDLSFGSFDAGSNVTANVSYGGTFIATQNFTWDNSNTNYIGITGRQDGDGWTVDNLVIEANVVPEPSTLAMVAALMAVGGSAIRVRRNRRA